MVMMVVVFLLQKLHAVGQAEGLSFWLHGGKDGINPGVGFSPEVNKEIAVLDPKDIGRSRLIGMAFRAGREEQGNVGQIPDGGAGEIVSREDRGDDLKPSWSGFRDSGAAAGKQDAEQEQGRETFHGRTSSRIKKVNPSLNHTTAMGKKQARKM
jgi:hypothetical protein